MEKIEAGEFYFANPYLIDNEQYFLMLNFHPIEKFDEHRDASITFLGGFDHPDVVNDVGKETTFLAFTYPVSNIDELARDIGSIDFRKGDRESSLKDERPERG